MIVEISAWLLALLVVFLFLDWYRRQSTVPNLSNKYILITGCDTGFGKLLAIRLDSLGCQVIAACLTETGERDLLRQCSPRTRVIQLDVRDQSSVKRAFELVTLMLPDGKGLWGLVNNAAIPGVSSGPLEWLNANDFSKVMEVNTLGLIDITLTFLPLLKLAQGRIVNMSSTGARLVGPLALPYDVSKAAVEAFSDGLRRHLLVYGSRTSVHVIEPSLFRTEMVSSDRHQRLLQNTWQRLPPRMRQQFGDKFYAAYVHHTLESMARFASTDYNKVTDAYVHALTAQCPHTRYLVGYRASLFSIPLTYLPGRLVDWLVCALHPSIKPSSDTTAFRKREVRFSDNDSGYSNSNLS